MKKTDYDKIKSKQLGMAISTARLHLLKSIIFGLARDTERNICYRCHKPIETIDEFTIDHIKNWMYREDAKELYFDYNNIAFSHHGCNSSATRCRRITYTTFRYKGVSALTKNRKKQYRANINYNGKTSCLGYFATAEEAAQAYDAKALELFGENAVTNKMLGLFG